MRAGRRGRGSWALGSSAVTSIALSRSSRGQVVDGSEEVEAADGVSAARREDRGTDGSPSDSEVARERRAGSGEGEWRTLRFLEDRELREISARRFTATPSTCRTPQLAPEPYSCVVRVRARRLLLFAEKLSDEAERESAPVDSKLFQLWMSATCRAISRHEASTLGPKCVRSLQFQLGTRIVGCRPAMSSFKASHSVVTVSREFALPP